MSPPTGEVDEGFRALRDRTGRAVADAALERARALGAAHADVRVHRLRTVSVRLRDAVLDSAHDGEDVGVGVRVLVDGTWGFAGGVDVTPEAAATLAEQAVRAARVSRALRGAPVELAPEAPVQVEWASPYELDPFAVSGRDRVAVLAELSGRVLSAGVPHVDAEVEVVREQVFYADAAGAEATQQRVRVQPQLTALRVDDGRLSSQRTTLPPMGRGWEAVVGAGVHAPGAAAWDLAAEVDALPGHLAEHAAAPSVAPGRYDLVVDPSNLWLTIHESVGHATELDRAVGYEAAYAGTSFATPDRLGSLRYGSPVMHVVGDRTTPHGLASVAVDDEGVPAQAFDLVRDGVLVGYQLNRQMAAEHGFGRSNGCAYADSAGHIPLQRMANVSLQPATDGPTLDELVAGVEHGLLVVGDKSWSIDQQRFNFQFTGQRFHRIEHGRIAGPVRDVAYQATTTDFWGSLRAVGGRSTFALGGALNCGKGQPGQIAPVSHGCPAAVFEHVNVLDTSGEAS